MDFRWTRFYKKFTLWKSTYDLMVNIIMHHAPFFSRITWFVTQFYDIDFKIR